MVREEENSLKEVDARAPYPKVRPSAPRTRRLVTITQFFPGSQSTIHLVSLAVPRRFQAGWQPKLLCRPAGARCGSAQRPVRNPPGPAPLTLASTRQRVWPALRAAPGQGRGAGGRRCRTRGQQQCEHWKGWHGAQRGGPGGGQPRGLVMPAGGRGGAPGSGPRDQGLPPGAGGTLQPEGPAGDPGRRSGRSGGWLA